MFHKWCEKTSCDGIADLYESRNNKGRFLFWSVIMAAMFVTSILFTYKTMIYYMETPTVTNVATVRQSKLDMPEIMLCYKGGLNTTAMKEHFSDNLIISLTKALFPMVDNQSLDLDLASRELQDYMTATKLDIKGVINQFSFNCDDVVVSVMQPADLIWHYSGCEFTVPAVFSVGRCFIFKNISQQTFPSLKGGLKIQLKRPKNSFSDIFVNESKKFEIGNDFKLFMERAIGFDQTKRSFTIPIGIRSEVTLLTKLYKRDPGITDCTNGEPFENSNTCFYQCYVVEKIRSCNCVPIYWWFNDSAYANVSTCDVFQNTCDDPQVEIEACQSRCKPMCEEWIFESSFTFGVLQDKSHALLVIGYGTMHYTQVRISFIKLYFYYASSGADPIM